MIVKNEEKYLNDCLQSVQGVADEIVLVDTGSTDRTIEIAQKFGAKIFQFNWINDFSAARNYALENSSGDWILYLDADERLSPDSRAEIKKLTKAKKDEAYYCIVDNIDEIGHRAALMAYARLFPNNKALRFEGAIHEQIEPSLLKNKIGIKNADVKIIHIGYNIQKDELNAKAKRNLEILSSEYDRTKSSYYAYQLGQTYGILEERDKAVYYFSEALKDSGLASDYISTAYRYIAVDHAKKRNYNLAIETINKCLAADREQPLALLAASSIYLLVNDVIKADTFCKEAFSVNKKLMVQKKFSAQIPLSDDRSILFHGLSISVQARDKNLYNYYFDLIKRSNYIKDSTELQNLFFALFNNKSINEHDLQKYVSAVDESNINVVLNVLKDYQNIECKFNLMKSLYPKFLSNYNFLNSYGLILSVQNKVNEAENILEQSYLLNPYEASTIFYLISSYLKSNKAHKIKVLLKDAEEKFKDVPEVLERINLIKTKLQSIISA